MTTTLDTGEWWLSTTTQLSREVELVWLAGLPRDNRTATRINQLLLNYVYKRNDYYNSVEYIGSAESRILVPITLSNAKRFLKFWHLHALCNKVAITSSTTSSTYRYSNLWNIRQPLSKSCQYPDVCPVVIFFVTEHVLYAQYAATLISILHKHQHMTTIINNFHVHHKLNNALVLNFKQINVN